MTMVRSAGRTRIAAALGVAAALALLGCGGKVAAPPAPTAVASAPDFELKDLDGKVFKLSDAKGTVRLVDFWATWCAPCREEIPMFKELQAAYGPKGFKLVGIAMDDEGLEKVKPFADDLKISYLTLIGNESVATAFGGIVGFPSKFLVDREGRIVDRWVGVVPRSVLEKRIQSLL